MSMIYCPNIGCCVCTPLFGQAGDSFPGRMSLKVFPSEYFEGHVTCLVQRKICLPLPKKLPSQPVHRLLWLLLEFPSAQPTRSTARFATAERAPDFNSLFCSGCDNASVPHNLWHIRHRLSWTTKAGDYFHSPRFSLLRPTRVMLGRTN